MTTIVGVAEAVLYVADLERATRFYTEALGLPVTAAFDDARFLQTGRDSSLILFDIDKLEKRESPIPGHGARGRGHVALAVATAEMGDWRRRLLDKGVAIEHEQEWPQGTHSIYFRDPDQNSVELIDGRHYPKVWQRLQNKIGD